MKALPPCLGPSRPTHICHWYIRFRNLNLSLNIETCVAKVLISLKKKKEEEKSPSSSLMWIMGKHDENQFLYENCRWNCCSFVLNQESIMMQPNSCLCTWFGAGVCTGCIYLFFMVFFYVCKQHSLTWNISQFKCQPLNTQNGQSIFFRAYSQFLVLCECWEQWKRNQRNKEKSDLGRGCP